MKRILVVLGVLFAGLAFADGAQAQNYVRDGFGKCMHVPQENRSNGVQLRTWDCVNKAHLKWEQTFLLLGNDRFWLKNNLTGKCAAVHAGHKDDGSAVVQWDCRGEENFQWAILHGGQIMNLQSKKCLHSDSSQNYAPVTIKTCWGADIPKGQLWDWMAPSKSDGLLFRNRSSGTCLHVPYESRTDNTQLTTWDCKALLQMKWSAERVATDEHIYRSAFSGKCMAVHPVQMKTGAKVIQWSCSKDLNFRWKILQRRFQSGLAIQYQHVASRMCLTVESVAKNSPAIVAPCKGEDAPLNMQWILLGPDGRAL